MKTLTCTCGATIEGADEESVVRDAMEHVKANHPEMAEGKTDDEVRSMLQGMVTDKPEDNQ